MSAADTILVGCFENVAWIRVEGEASHRNSARVRDFAGNQIDRGRWNFVVDLQNCPGMDSTFMGTLTAIALQLKGSNGNPSGTLQIVNANERNRTSIRKLGLQCVLDVDEDGKTWIEERELVDRNVSKSLPAAEMNHRERTEMVMNAHEALVQANENNISRFQDVLEYLKRDLDSNSA